jgi:MFS family permease
MVLSGGIAWFTFPVFVPPLKSEFGWTDFQIGIALGLWAFVSAAISPILGHLVDRFGARWMMLAGAFGGGLVCFGMAHIRGLEHLYVILVFAALTSAASTYIPVTNLMTRWFVRRRGLAMGIAMTGIGLGGFLLPNVTSFLVRSVGWRFTYRIFGAALWVILLPVIAVWVYGDPSDKGLKPEGEEDTGNVSPGTECDSTVTEGLTAREAFALPRFWLIGLADVTQAIPVMALGLYMVDYSIGAGIEESVAAFAFSSISAAAMLGTILAGPVGDRISRRLLVPLCYGLPALAVFSLFDLKSPAPLFIYTLFAGLCTGGRTALWPILVSDCFGNRSYSTVLGFLIIFYSIGSIIGPPLAGRISDATGSFYWVFVLSVISYAVSGILLAIGARVAPAESSGKGPDAS